MFGRNESGISQRNFALISVILDYTEMIIDVMLSTVVLMFWLYTIFAVNFRSLLLITTTYIIAPLIDGLITDLGSTEVEMVDKLSK